MTWATDAQDYIHEIHLRMPGCTAEELRKALRRASSAFTGGTSWGAKVWPRECRRYIAAQFGTVSALPASAVAKIDRPDIHFPWKGESNGT